MTIKQEIINYLSDRDHGTIGYDQTILDANHFARRMLDAGLMAHTSESLNTTRIVIAPETITTTTKPFAVLLSILL